MDTLYIRPRNTLLAEIQQRLWIDALHGWLRRPDTSDKPNRELAALAREYKASLVVEGSQVTCQAPRVNVAQSVDLFRGVFNDFCAHRSNMAIFIAENCRYDDVLTQQQKRNVEEERVEAARDILSKFMAWPNGGDSIDIHKTAQPEEVVIPGSDVSAPPDKGESILKEAAKLFRAAEAVKAGDMVAADSDEAVRPANKNNDRFPAVTDPPYAKLFGKTGGPMIVSVDGIEIGYVERFDTFRSRGPVHELRVHGDDLYAHGITPPMKIEMSIVAFEADRLKIKSIPDEVEHAVYKQAVQFGCTDTSARKLAQAASASRLTATSSKQQQDYIDWMEKVVCTVLGLPIETFHGAKKLRDIHETACKPNLYEWMHRMERMVMERFAVPIDYIGLGVGPQEYAASGAKVQAEMTKISEDIKALAVGLNNPVHPVATAPLTPYAGSPIRDLITKPCTSIAEGINRRMDQEIKAVSMGAKVEEVRCSKCDGPISSMEGVTRCVKCFPSSDS